MQIDKSTVVLRATTLWAFAECALGGIMHAVRSPFTGLIVASFSIAMIGVIVRVGKADFRTLISALVAVLTVKFLLSPHSSPSAYLAVSFQAFAGFAILKVISPTRLAMVLLGIVALTESALQKIIVLLILFGSSLTEAIDTWQMWISKKYDVYLSWLSFDTMAYGYVAIFALVGAAAGWLATNLIKSLQNTTHIPKISLPVNTAVVSSKPQKNRAGKRVFTISIIVLLLLSTYLIADSELSYLPWIRVVIFVLLWILVVLPLFRHVGAKYLFKNDVSHITSEFAHLKAVFTFLWRQSERTTWIGKVIRVLTTFVKTYLLIETETKP